MTKKLWSINALATEFQLDRRTVTLRVAGVAPAGKVGGHDRWHLADVAGALAQNGYRPAPSGPVMLSHGDQLLDAFSSRIDDRFEIEAAHRDLAPGDLDPRNVTINEAADMLGEPPATILHWIRAGAPVRERGNLETGKGFRLDFAALFDWMCLVARAIAYARDRDRACDAQGRHYAQLLKISLR